MNARQRRTEKRKFLKDFNKALVKGLISATETSLSKEEKKAVVKKLKLVK